MNVNLTCRCGSVKGIAHKVSPSTGIRLICQCDDCQAFANYVDKGGDTLDQYGACDVFQMPMARVEITAGSERMKCVRLKPKGLYRWYASCCNTPIGNAVANQIPTFGVFNNFMEHPIDRDELIGATNNYLFAKDPAPAERQRASTAVIILKIVSHMLFWRILGLHKPSSFFKNNGEPVSEPLVLDDQ